MTADQDNDRKAPLLSTRTTMVFLLAVLSGAIAGILTARAGHAVSEAVLIGAGALAAGLKFFDWLIRHDC
jgi:hypothetical protein